LRKANLYKRFEAIRKAIAVYQTENNPHETDEEMLIEYIEYQLKMLKEGK
jgi:metal-responsive CopG/Arc/MetJ family transcriptional regulator